MNKQEVFNTVATHLLTQKTKSLKVEYGVDRCMYRGPDGLKCAIGCLIKDEFYSKEMEGREVCHAPVKSALIKSGFDIQGDDQHFLMRLQRIHDSSQPRYWRNFLINLAREYNLDSSAATNFISKE